MPSVFMPTEEFQRLFVAGTQAANRMVAAVDPAFAAQQRYNRALSEANELQAMGFLTGQRYQQVHGAITRQLEEELQVNSRLGTSMAQRRAGMQQLGFQLGDIAQGLAVGTSGAVIFAQQSGQVVQAMQLMGGEGSAFMRFLGGPWGIGLSVAAVALTPLIGRLLDTRTEFRRQPMSLRRIVTRRTSTDRRRKPTVARFPESSKTFGSRRAR